MDRNEKIITALIVIVFMLLAVIVTVAFINWTAQKQSVAASVTTPTVAPTATPATSCERVATPEPTYKPRVVTYNPVPTEIPRHHQKPLDGAVSRINWGDLKGDLQKEDLAYWLGKENSQWPVKYREIMYQMILGYQQKNNEIVVVKSATLRKVIYSTDNGIYLAENVSAGDYSEYKIVVYATTFDIDGQSYKMLTGYSQKNNNLLIQGYGPSDQIVTEPGFIDGGEGGGVSSASSSTSGNSPAPSGPSGPVGGVGG